MVPQQLLLKKKENFAVEMGLKCSSAWDLYHCGCCWGKLQVCAVTNTTQLADGSLHRL